MGRYLKNYRTLDIAKADDTIVSPNVSLIANIKILHLNTHTKGEGLSIAGDSLENAQIVVKPTICHTQCACADTNYYYVEIQFEEGMTWNDFISSSYNDVSKMTGESSSIGRFSLDSEGYVLSPVYGFGPGDYPTAQKGTDRIIPNIQYEVPGHGSNSHRIYYGSSPV